MTKVGQAESKSRMDGSSENREQRKAIPSEEQGMNAGKGWWNW